MVCKMILSSVITSSLGSAPKFSPRLLLHEALGRLDDVAALLRGLLHLAGEEEAVARRYLLARN